MKNLILFIRANLLTLIIFMFAVVVIIKGAIFAFDTTDVNKFPTKFYLDYDVISDTQCLTYIVDDYGEIVCIDNNAFNHTPDNSPETQHKIIEFIECFPGDTNIEQLSVDYQNAVDNFERTGNIE